MDTLATVTGTALILAIIVYSLYMTYTHRQTLLSIKNEIMSQVLQSRMGASASVSDVEQEFLNPANNVKNLIPCPPPAPIPPTNTINKDIGSLKPLVEKENKSQNGNFTSNGSLLATPVWLQEIKSNEIFNKRKKISCTDDAEGEVDDEDGEDDGDNGDDEYPDVKILHKTIDNNLMSKKEYVY